MRKEKNRPRDEDARRVLHINLAYAPKRQGKVEGENRVAVVQAYGPEGLKAKDVATLCTHDLQDGAATTHWGLR